MVSKGMPLAQAYRAVQQALEGAGCPDAAFDAADLCLLVTGQTVHGADQSRVLSEAQAAQLWAVTQRRMNREPLQYIWGRWPFLNFELVVGEGVLCPRADTEIVVQWAAVCLSVLARQTSAKALQLAQPPLQGTAHMGQGMPCFAPKVLELCGGSGCIGLGIKMFCPAAQITVLEKSAAALPYLHQNAAHALDALAAQAPHNALASPYIKVVEGDLFAYHHTLPEATFDLLVSNPPYLSEAEMEQLQPEVTREPAMALVAGQDGLTFYRAIALAYQRVIKPGGYLVLEIGCAQAEAVLALLRAAGWELPICKQDYGNNDRCIIARRP